MAKTHTPSEICGKDRGRQGKNQKSLKVKVACFWLLVAGYLLLVVSLKDVRKYRLPNQQLMPSNQQQTSGYFSFFIKLQLV